MPVLTSESSWGTNAAISAVMTATGRVAPANLIAVYHDVSVGIMLGANCTKINLLITVAEIT